MEITDRLSRLGKVVIWVYTAWGSLFHIVMRLEISPPSRKVDEEVRKKVIADRAHLSVEHRVCAIEKYDDVWHSRWTRLWRYANSVTFCIGASVLNLFALGRLSIRVIGFVRLYY